jgi:hypothetical protein
VRRLIAIVLMLLLPLQSAWAMVAMPCRAHVSPPPAVAAAALALVAAHDGHAGPGGHHAAMAGHEHPGAADASVPAHAHHAHHAVAPAAGHDVGASGGPSSQGPDACSGSAACMSLHSPPLAPGFDAGLPALQLPSLRPRADGERFSSVPLQRLHRPPIGPAA